MSPRIHRHEAVEEQYCKAIFEFAEDLRVDVIRARLAEALGVSRPTVSETVARLRDRGLVADGRHLTLTDEGVAVAVTAVRRHRLIERLLTDVLGIPASAAHHEAVRLEQVVSRRVEAAVDELLHHPTTCPHGNPIPGSGHQSADTVPLHSLDVGDEFVVVRISEALEWVPDFLEYLEASAVRPGAVGVVSAVSPDGATTIRTGESHVGIGRYASDRIWVTVAGANAAPRVPAVPAG